MFFFRSRRISALCLMLAGFGLMGSMPYHYSTVKKRYLIENGSRFYLKGSSNVNSFTCDCYDQYSEQILDVESKGGYARLKNADLQLKSRKFDCHNRKIDTDMQKALKADQYPFIKASLVETWQDAKCLNGGCKDWFDVQANVKITITNVCRTEAIAAKAKVLGPNRFQITGEKALQMTAFGINPPEAMFGMIKVNDWITFHFDLIVSIGETQ